MERPVRRRLAPEARKLEIVQAAERLRKHLGPAIPEMTVLKRLEEGETYDAGAVLARREGNLAAVLTGTPAEPPQCRFSHESAVVLVQSLLINELIDILKALQGIDNATWSVFTLDERPKSSLVSFSGRKRCWLSWMLRHPSR